MKADSGASRHYIRQSDTNILQQIKTITDGPCVSLPDNTVMTGTQQGYLPLDRTSLSPNATQAHVFPHLSSASLLSLGQLCDDDCKVYLDKHSLQVYKHDKVVLTGKRNYTDGLWDVLIQSPSPAPPSSASSERIQSANVIIHKKQTTKQLAQYLHAACGSPPISTFLKAIKSGLLQSWPGIDLIKESDLSPTIATAKGHLDQERKNIQSTKAPTRASSPPNPPTTQHRDAVETTSSSTPAAPVPPTVNENAVHTDMQTTRRTNNDNQTGKDNSSTRTQSPASHPDASFSHQPIQQTYHDDQKGEVNSRTQLSSSALHPDASSPLPEYGPPNKTHECFASIDQFDRKAYSDLTGRYPHISSRGNQYILVVYDYDSSGILVEPLKNRQAAEITKAWMAIHNRLSRHGNSPQLYILDNEVSFEFKAALRKRNVQYQLVPPHVHRRNAAERAIRTFKNHFLSVLATADPNFPVSEWDRLLPQAELTLNLLCPCCLNPRLSAYAFLFGLFDFNRTPLAPAGTRVLVHEKSRQRASWANHGIEGWYIGPSLEHYRCVKCYLPSTGGVRDADTVQFFPKQVPFPKMSTEDMLLQSATDILAILQSPPPSLVPTIQYGDEAKNAIEHLARLLQRAVQKTKPLPPPKPLPRRSPRIATNALPASLPRVVHPTPVPRVQPLSHTPVSPSPRPITAAAANVTNIPITFANPDPSGRKHAACSHLLAQTMFSSPRVNHIYNSTTGKRETIDSLIVGPNAPIWRRALSNELGRLSNGVDGRIVGTNTIAFIHKHEVPPNKKVTYANMVCDHRPLKSEPDRVRLTVGGDRLDYAHDVGSPTASLLEAKLLLNSTISDADKGARFFAVDIKDFFLATPMSEYEYMHIHSKYFF